MKQLRVPSGFVTQYGPPVDDGRIVGTVVVVERRVVAGAVVLGLRTVVLGELTTVVVAWSATDVDVVSRAVGTVGSSDVEVTEVVVDFEEPFHEPQPGAALNRAASAAAEATASRRCHGNRRPRRRQARADSDPRDASSPAISGT